MIPKGSNLFQLLFDFISITLAVWAILPKDTTNVMHVTANRQPKRKFITNIINSASITFNNYFIILSLLFLVGSYSPEENFERCLANSKERHKHLPVLEVTKRPLFSHQWYPIRWRFARFIHLFISNCLQTNLSKTICTTKAKLGFIYYSLLLQSKLSPYEANWQDI